MSLFRKPESPAEITLKADDEKNEATLAQRLYFLKGLLGGESFQAAVQRIVTMPNTKWREQFGVESTAETVLKAGK